MQNISLRSSGMRRKQNFDISTLSLLPSFFAFLASFFFSLPGHLVGFILVGRVFRKAFRILGLGERKGRWVMEQDFHVDFQVLVTWFFASFSGVLDWIVLILVWFERSLYSAQHSEESCPWPLKLMTSQRVERTWIRTGGSGANGLNFDYMNRVNEMNWKYIIFKYFFECNPKRPLQLNIMVVCPENPKQDQNLKFSPLSETTSIPSPFHIRSLPPPPGVG